MLIYSAAAAIPVVVTLLAVLSPSPACAAGSASTIAIAADSSTVCGVTYGPPSSVLCARPGDRASSFPIPPNISFSSISGGSASLCGLRSGGTAFFCWNASDSSATAFRPKRLYNGPDGLEELAVGAAQIASIDIGRTGVRWWRENHRFPSFANGSYSSLTSGQAFTCAVDTNNSVRCWGPLGDEIQAFFANSTVLRIYAGDNHACSIDTGGRVICSNGQTPPSSPNSAFEFRSLALGFNHTCAVRRTNGTVVCWDGGTGGEYAPANMTAFELIVAGGNLTCGLTTANFSVLCWGMDRNNPAVTRLPLPEILPGICISNQSSCRCGVFPNSENLCSGSEVICQRCDDLTQQSSPLSPPPPQFPPSSSSRTNRGWRAFAIIGLVGTFAGLCSIVYCIWVGICRRKKVHNSVQPTITASANCGPHTGLSSGTGGPLSSTFVSPSASRSRIFRRQGSRVMSRQRSGPSSFKDRAEEFSFEELAAATNNFSFETKIGGGSFGTVYKGKLADGREVAIKRSESVPRTNKFQEKESAFQSELAFLSRLHHKHLVALVGYCEEKEERLLVYEYMKNGALYDHLHPKNDGESSVSSVLNSWKMRIKVLLDAARGIEYLHSYAVPPIIHRDIKSSNILLDANWVARVSDFGLSLMGPESEGDHLSLRAAGTVGYMDPEYYGLQHLTVKSDVYGLGVVMLEVLTGRRAIFKDDDGNPTSVVAYAVPFVVAGEVGKVLDVRVGQPLQQEAEAVELVAYTAVHCVNVEGKERPSMTDIVANLESALALCEESHGTISSASISLASVD